MLLTHKVLSKNSRLTDLNYGICLSGSDLHKDWQATLQFYGDLREWTWSFDNRNDEVFLAKILWYNPLSHVLNDSRWTICRVLNWLFFLDIVILRGLQGWLRLDWQFASHSYRKGLVEFLSFWAMILRSCWLLILFVY